MDIEPEPIVRDENSDSVTRLKEKALILWPVPDNAAGEGLPYAPVNWPNPGDVWRWKVGKRRNSSGFMMDRYLYPPRQFQKPFKMPKPYYASLQSFREFVKNDFPGTDCEALLASFSWKVPAKAHYGYADQIMSEYSGPDLYPAMKCKARNRLCSSQLEPRDNSLQVMDCDICCTEPSFCRDCCCILCSKTIDSTHGGYSFIRCESSINQTFICGHAAHLDCALRSYMAGTVGGSIGLDVEYYCRRCDNRTNLIPHVEKLLKICESLDSRDNLEKILKVGLCILRGSNQERAKRTLNRIELMLTKLIGGVDIKDIWNMKDEAMVVSSGLKTLHFESNGECTPVYITSDHVIESSKLDNEIEEVLQDLKSSQELEYRMAEQRLNAQKDLILTLYQELDADRAELSKRTGATRDSDVGALLNRILSKVNQINQEVDKFKDLESVGKGFGKIPPANNHSPGKRVEAKKEKRNNFLM
ncbi:hypothetical protein ACHQM5_014749 [Ranunculus cassubicifolius]